MTVLERALLAAREEGDQAAFQSFDRETAEGLDLSDLTFRQVRFDHCQFVDCDLSSAAFYGCELKNCVFLSCRLAGSFWRDSVFSDGKAEGGDFRKARFKGCTLDRLRLRWANFTGALWERCTLSGCSLAESTCQEFKVVKTALKDVDFTGANLFRAVLTGADLSGCTLDGISLSASCQELRGTKIHSSQAAVVARILGIEVLE